ncbi:MAG: ABC transporter permease [Bacteroidetes bacterium]|nr:ABC transporter permease [Bacteroidota bacterium]
MLKNYFKIAWRNITRHKLYSGINVFGLALGITCCLFIFLWVQDEKGVDNFFSNGPNLYTVYKSVKADGHMEGDYSTPRKYTPQVNIFALDGVEQAVPGVKQIGYFATGYELPWGHPETIQVGEKIIKLNGCRASENFFKLFDYPLLEGTPETALKNLYGIAISRKTAELFFGSAQAAIGKAVRFENKKDLTVSSVFENIPEKSSMQFDFLIPWETMRRHLIEWSGNGFRTYMELAPGADTKKVETAMNKFLATRLDPQERAAITVGLQRVSDQYLHSTFVNGKPATGRIEYVRIFTSVAIFILLIACVNFMNLATARSVKRAKEIGLRKVVGSLRSHLIGQFIGESLLFSLLATGLSLALLFTLLPAFNLFTGKHIQFPMTNLFFWITLLSAAIVTGLVAGSYPALYLSSLKPVKVLKGVVRYTQGSILFRKGLTVFQFVLTLVLLIATIVITRQTNYVQTTNLGYDRSNLLYVRIEGALGNIKGYSLFKQQAEALPGVAIVDRSSETPHSMNFLVTDDQITWEGKDKNSRVGVNPSSVGYDFVKLMNLQIVKGRDFSRSNPTDSADAFIVNETAVREMGWKDPIGKWVQAWQKKGHIIGVVKDFHIRSLHDPIAPILIDVKEFEYFGVIMIKTRPGQTRQALAGIERVYKDINPKYGFAYQFVDEEYSKLYASELIISKLSILFAVLAILISCMGLLGLVMFAAEQRTKEIGIRKVLGASLGQIITLFSSDFLWLIGIAFLIAGPLGWYAMNSWLHDFAYRIDLSWWIFVLAGATVVIIALATVSYQAIRAGLSNPVKSLRSE